MSIFSNKHYMQIIHENYKTKMFKELQMWDNQIVDFFFISLIFFSFPSDLGQYDIINLCVFACVCVCVWSTAVFWFLSLWLVKWKGMTAADKLLPLYQKIHKTWHWLIHRILWVSDINQNSPWQKRKAHKFWAKKWHRFRFQKRGRGSFHAVIYSTCKAFARGCPVMNGSYKL